VLGHEAELFHHLFVWPAFALLVGLGAWRALVGDKASPRGFAIYLAVLFLTAGLMAGAGYWGGELILNSSSAYSTGAPSSGLAVSPQLLAQGAGFYAQSCGDCHGDDGHGDEGPDLHNLAISDARIASQIKNGTKGEMPSFAKKYDDRQVTALVAYVRSLH
jgi:mono/diheme cytochrome c family protein